MKQDRHTQTTDKPHDALYTPSIEKGFELTRTEEFLDGSADMFDMLQARHAEILKNSRLAAPSDNKNKKPVSKASLIDTLTKAVFSLTKASSAAQKTEDFVAQQNLKTRAVQAHIESIPTVDALTGLLNRRGFLKLFARELTRLERRTSSKKGILVIIDVENYAALQAKFGQRAAEKSIYVTGKLLAKDIRDMDAAARTNTDEFTLMMPGTTKEEAIERIQRLALRLNNLAFVDNGQELSIHAGIRIKTYGGTDNADKLLASIAEQSNLAQSLQR